jgi:hypothetical protein
MIETRLSTRRIESPGASHGNDRLESGNGAGSGRWVLEQPSRVVVAEDGSVDLKRHELRIEVSSEVPDLDPHPNGLRQRVEPPLLLRDEHVAGRAWPVVELGRGMHEDAAAGQTLVMLPFEPALEERTKTRLAARCAKCRFHNDISELLGCGRDDVDLQRFLRLEVREEPALRHPDVRGNAAEGDAFEPIDAGGSECGLDDPRSGGISFGHGRKSTTDRS